MNLCPLNKFEECKGILCPFYNIKYEACLLPRVLLAVIEISRNTKIMADSMAPMTADRPGRKSKW